MKDIHAHYLALKDLADDVPFLAQLDNVLYASHSLDGCSHTIDLDCGEDHSVGSYDLGMQAFDPVMKWQRLWHGRGCHPEEGGDLDMFDEDNGALQKGVIATARKQHELLSPRLGRARARPCRAGGYA